MSIFIDSSILVDHDLSKPIDYQIGLYRTLENRRVLKAPWVADPGDVRIIDFESIASQFEWSVIEQSQEQVRSFPVYRYLSNHITLLRRRHWEPPTKLLQAYEKLRSDQVHRYLAVGRKLAVIMHRMLITGEEFRYEDPKSELKTKITVNKMTGLVEAVST